MASLTATAPSAPPSPFPSDFHPSATPSSPYDYPSSPGVNPPLSATGSFSRLRSVFRLPKSKKERDRPALSPETYSSSTPSSSPASPSGASFVGSQPATPYNFNGDPLAAFGATINGTTHTDQAPKVPEIDPTSPLTASFSVHHDAADAESQLERDSDKARQSGHTGSTALTSSSYNVNLSHATPPTPSIRTTAPLDEPEAISNGPSGELIRPYSTVTNSSTDHSSSSGSRLPSSSSPYANAASSYTSSSANTPLRSPGMGLKHKFFGTTPVTPRDTDTEPPAKTSESSSSSQSKDTSPRKDRDSRSATARFLRRVVSAPNAKALTSLFAPSATAEPLPPVPPIPAKPPKRRGPGPLALPKADFSLASTDSINSPGSSASLPFRSPGLSPPVTRALRSHSSAHASAKKAGHAALGISGGQLSPGASPDSPAKGVFRRTYSSNSIKTRSVSHHTLVNDSPRISPLTLQVEVGPSSFQKIKLLGKGDVGKVYLVREKKTDKLFAMKGEFLVAVLERS